MAKDYGSHGRYACSDDEWQIGIRGRRYEFMSLIQSISKALFRLAPLLSAVGRKVVKMVLCRLLRKVLGLK